MVESVNKATTMSFFASIYYDNKGVTIVDVFEFILQIVLVLLVAKIAGQISIRLGQPSVLGKIIAGIVLGPAVLGWIEQTELIHVFSEIGVLLLMFLAGLETDLESLNKNVSGNTCSNFRSSNANFNGVGRFTTIWYSYI